jgi:hypothetical protein
MATAKVTPSFVEKMEMGSARVRLQFSKRVIAWLNYASTQLQEAGRFVGEFIDVRHAPEWLGKCCSKVETLMYSATRICFINPPLICVFQR